MKTAIYPGSFDPITFGHLDIIKRASEIFDVVTVSVLDNINKKAAFSVEERMDFIRRCTKDIPNVKVDSFSGLLANYVKTKSANCVVRGLRALSDFEYEFQMALTNKKINPEMDTMFLTTSMEYMYLSSSMVKEVATFGYDIKDFVPDPVVKDVINKLNK